MVIQTKNHNQLTGGISIIKYKQHMAPIMGMIEYFLKKLKMATTINMNVNTKNKTS
jgi:hypothetical protein